MVKRNFIGQKLILVPAVALLLSLLLSLSKQLIAHTKANQRLLQKQAELLQLERKNKQLKEKMEIVSSPQFREEQERRLLGAVQEGQIAVLDESETNEPEVVEKMPNYRKWWRLFVN